MRPLLFDHRPQRGAVEHVDHVAAMRDLHGRRVGVAVDGNHLHAQALQFDDQLLAELAATTEQDTGGAGGQRGAYSWHGIPRFLK